MKIRSVIMTVCSYLTKAFAWIKKKPFRCTKFKRTIWLRSSGMSSNSMAALCNTFTSKTIIMRIHLHLRFLTQPMLCSHIISLGSNFSFEGEIATYLCTASLLCDFHFHSCRRSVVTATALVKKWCTFKLLLCSAQVISRLQCASCRAYLLCILF